MPVTIKTADHAPQKWEPRGRQGIEEPASSRESILQQACPSEHRRTKWIIQSSFNNEDLASASTPIYASTNGFVRAVVAAYCDHHHLRIRPEDVWFSILTQLSFYVNAHSEELRSFFVSHEGKKLLTVYFHQPLKYADFGAMAVKMTLLLEKAVIDSELRTWIMPDFSTTEPSDRVVAAILMMGALQQYFEYQFTRCCGIPSVTLLGDRADWEKILDRLDKLSQLGTEPAQFGALLKPILRFFVKSFDDPSDPAVVDFWGRIADRQRHGSGSTDLSGWIVAFCYWKADGKCLYTTPRPRPSNNRFHREPIMPCEIDGTQYHTIAISDIPDGSAAVPVTVNDDGTIYKTRMVAGSVGIKVTESGDILDSKGPPNGWNTGPDGVTMIPYWKKPEPAPETGLDTLQPVSGWWMYEVLEGKEGDMTEEEKMETYLASDNPRMQRIGHSMAARLALEKNNKRLDMVGTQQIA